MGDINKYVLSKKIRNSATKLGIRELITDRYGSMGSGTTISNKKKQAIYGIWGSKGIKIFQGGYIPFHFGTKSYHRLFWIKITHLVAFGDKNPPLRSTAARRLRLHHQRVQKIYQNSGISQDKGIYFRDSET